MEPTHTLYAVVLPNGSQYIGQTSQTVEERFRSHASYARRSAHRRHPFYDSLRKYGTDSVKLVTLGHAATQAEADLAEIRFISAARKAGKCLNVSGGGGGDLTAAHTAFRALLADPKRKAKYVANLKRAVLVSEAHAHHRLNGLQDAWAGWHQSNTRVAYYMAYRASRIASGGKPKPDPRFAPGGRLYIRSDKVRAKRMSVERRGKRTWHAAPADVKAKVHAKIGEGVKANHAAKTPAEKEAADSQLAKARQNIDHDKRKRNQKAALNAYWTPERKAAKAEAMRAHWAKKREAK